MAGDPAEGDGHIGEPLLVQPAIIGSPGGTSGTAHRFVQLASHLPPADIIQLPPGSGGGYLVVRRRTTRQGCLEQWQRPGAAPPRQSAQTLWRDCQRSAGYRIWRPPSQLVGALATSGDTSASLQHCSSWQRACRTSGSMRAPQLQPPRQEQAPPPRSSRQQPGGSPLGWRPCQASQKRWTALHWRQAAQAPRTRL